MEANDNVEMISLLGLVIGLVAGFLLGLIGMALATVLMAVVAEVSKGNVLTTVILTFVGGLLGMGVTFVLLL